MTENKRTTAEQFAEFFEAHMRPTDLFATTTEKDDTEENEQ